METFVIYLKSGNKVEVQATTFIYDGALYFIDDQGNKIDRFFINPNEIEAIVPQIQ